MYKYNLEKAIDHTRQADMWLVLYEREQTPTRRILLEHYIHLAKHHITKAKEIDSVIDRDDGTMARNQSPRP